MDAETKTAPPIVLIHGFWLTARSWERWVDHYTERGYQVLAPSYPGLEVEVEALREDPSPIRDLTIEKILEHLKGIVRGLDRPPILMGHSAGGTLVQLLLDRGYGAAGVAIDSAPPEGVYRIPLSQIRSVFPVLRNPANRRRAVPLTPEQFHYVFTNTMSQEQSRAIYDRYAVPGPGGIVWEGVLANLTPGRHSAWVDFTNDDRAPLLFIASGKDHIMPPSVNASNLKQYRRSKAVTEFHEFPGRSHFTLGEPGWEAVADYALDWALRQLDESGTTPGDNPSVT